MWFLIWTARAYASEVFVPDCPSEVPDCVAFPNLEDALAAVPDDATIVATANLLAIHEFEAPPIVSVTRPVTIRGWSYPPTVPRFNSTSDLSLVNVTLTPVLASMNYLESFGGTLRLERVVASGSLAGQGHLVAIQDGNLEVDNLEVRRVTGIGADGALIDVRGKASVRIENSIIANTPRFLYAKGGAASALDIHISNVELRNISDNTVRIYGDNEGSVTLLVENTSVEDCATSIFDVQSENNLIGTFVVAANGAALVDAHFSAVDFRRSGAPIFVQGDVDEPWLGAAHLENVTVSEAISAGDVRYGTINLVGLDRVDVDGLIFCNSDQYGYGLLNISNEFRMTNSAILAPSSSESLLASAGPATIENSVLVNPIGSVLMADMDAQPETVIHNSILSTTTNILRTTFGEPAQTYFPPSISHSALWDPTGTQTWADLTTGAVTDSVIVADPGFQNYVPGVTSCEEMVLWLEANSPLRDAGDPDAAFNDPDGSRNDIGMYGGPDAPLVDADLDGVWEDLDCDEADPDVYPGAPEIPYDGYDQDCTGLDLLDVDGDGFGIGVDCVDTDPNAYPGAPEDWYSGVDEACDGGNDFDRDGDGFVSSGYGGSDCDDKNANIRPGAFEIWYDGIDQDCDDNDLDRDGDGHAALIDAFGAPIPGGDDCNDLVDTIFAGAVEVWYDGVDQDCDGNDLDQDGDGADSIDHGGDDCDDLDPSVAPGALDEPYDGLDADCGGDDDFDADHDGDRSPAFGGADCDEGDPSVSSLAPELWYDGVDQNCDGNDLDQDGDGSLTPFDASGEPVEGGDDCNDLVAAIHPGAAEVWYDGVDQDCAEGDYDQDRDGYESQDHGGDDCDDTDASVHPGAKEDFAEIDRDCDGWGDPSGPVTPLNCEGCDNGGPGPSWALVTLGALALARRRRPSTGQA